MRINSLDHQTLGNLHIIDAFIDANLVQLGEYRQLEVDPAHTATFVDVDPEDDQQEWHTLATYVSIEQVDVSSLELNLGDQLLRLGRAALLRFADTSTISLVDLDSSGEELPHSERAIKFTPDTNCIRGWDLRCASTAHVLPVGALCVMVNGVAELLQNIDGQD